MNVRLRIDFIACAGRGICAELLPELITLDDWGFPIVSDEPVPERLVPDARLSASACPMLALHLRRDKIRDRTPAPPRPDYDLGPGC